MILYQSKSNYTLFPMSDFKRIYIVDIETTGFSPSRDCIVEIGMVSMDLDSLEMRDEFNEIVREEHFHFEKDKKAWIFRHSSLCPEDVINFGKNPSEFSDELSKLLKNPITAYNSGFDFNFLRNRGFEISHSLPDLMQLATNYVKERDCFAYRKLSAEKAHEELFGYKKEAHRALEDARLEGEILKELIRIGYYAPCV